MENYIGYVENDLVLESHDKVKGTDTEIAVDYKSPPAVKGKTYAEIRRNRRFPDPALAGGDHYDLTVAHTSPRRQTDSILYYIS